MPKTPRKILIVRFSSIGDIVLTTPVIRCLKKQLNCEVHFLCKESYRNILEPNPYLDKIFTIKKNVTEVIRPLKAENYDAIIDLHKNIRSLQLKLRLQKKVYTFDKINIQKWLIVTLKINKLPHIHIVERYLGAVRPLGVQNDGAGLDYFIPEQDNIDLSAFFRINLPESTAVLPDAYLALVIGAAHFTKRMPESLLVHICNRVNKPVVLLGGPNEKELADSVLEQSRGKVVNGCGQLNLHQSASLVKQAGLVITNDTGLMHIAAAFQKNVISVWGNTIPEFGMTPYLKEENADFMLEVEGLACRPCSKIGYADCPKGHFDCMQKQDLSKLEMILKKLGFVG